MDLENFSSKIFPSRIRLYVIPFDLSRRAESNGVNYSLIRDEKNFAEKFLSP